ncbi:MAG: hypothetical protein ACKPE3_38730, partial [Sphaerospermopsis kisseleviana]
MDSLKYWLGEIEHNQDGDKLTHWEIRVLIEELINCVPNMQLKIRVEPLLMTLKTEGKNHKHKALIAKFCLRIINDWEEMQ